MPLDAITLNTAVQELKTLVGGGKIERISQPERDEIFLGIKANKRHTLAISANANFPNIRLTKQKKQNPLSAPKFCMLLRKWLTGGKIQNISLLNNDRIVKILISNKNELGYEANSYLLCELMGRYSNIILTKEDFTIIDAIKRVPLEKSQNPTLPNLKYSPPPQNKISLNDKESLKELIDNNDDIDISFLMKNIGGIAKDTAKEILARKDQSPFEAIDAFFNIYGTSLFKPCLLYDKDNKPKDFYITPYISSKGTYVHYQTLNECMDIFYTTRNAENRKQADTKELVKTLKRLKSKLEKRALDCVKKLEESKDSHTYKIWGELILSNLHSIKKGDEFLECESYYDNKKVKIPLDKKLYPNQNAQAYFKKYRKLNKGGEIAAQQLKEIQKQKEYVLSIEAALQNSTNKEEYKEIQNELLALSNIKEPARKKQKERPSKPFHIVIEGISVYLGKNNIQNDNVTFEIASSNDIWMHTKGYHGAHAVIKSPNPPQGVLVRAAELCAYYSQARASSKADVDYTLRKNVKRQKGGMTGMVDYKNYKTIAVVPKDFTQDEKESLL